MQIKYEMLESDFLCASQLATHGRALWPKIRFWLIRVVGIVVLVISLLLFTQPGQKVPASLFFCYAMYCCFWPLITKQRAKRRFGKMTQMQGVHVLSAGPNGLQILSPAGEETTLWQAYDRVVEDKNSLLLIQRGDSLFVPIPKRELSNAQIDELRSLFKAHLTQK